MDDRWGMTEGGGVEQGRSIGKMGKTITEQQ